MEEKNNQIKTSHLENLTKEEIEKTGYKLIIFWFIVGFVLGALIF